MTREEFIKQRCEIDKITEEEFEETYRVVECNCGYPYCKGYRCLDLDDLLKENKQLKERIEYLERNNNRREDTILEQRQRISDLEDNWDKLKEYLITDIKYWQKQEREWIKLGFINFGGEANAKIIFKKVLDIMEDLEKGSDSNVRMEN